MENNQEYEILDILLLESTFNRGINVNFSSSDYTNNIALEKEHSFEDNILEVILKIQINCGVGEDIEVNFNIQMLGIFKKNPEINNIEINSFATINAPAIIFPFIREHIASLSAKARLPVIVLPPLNFVKMAEDNKKKDSLIEK